jgi:hypothetical protein
VKKTYFNLSELIKKYDIVPRGYDAEDAVILGTCTHCSAVLIKYEHNFIQKCSLCNGTGRWSGGSVCAQCSGAGGWTETDTDYIIYTLPEG